MNWHGRIEEAAINLGKSGGMGSVPRREPKVPRREKRPPRNPKKAATANPKTLQFLRQWERELSDSVEYGWENVLYESLTEAGVIFGKTHEKRFKKHIKAKRAKEAAKKKAAKKRARARQITLDSGDPEVAHMLDPSKPRRW